MSELIDKKNLSMLVETGFAACMQGKVLQARRIFENLLDYEVSTPAILGLAFSYLVVDDFDKGDGLLESLDQNSDDVKAFKVFSLVLQRKADEAYSLYETIVNKDLPSAVLAKNCLPMAER